MHNQVGCHVGQSSNTLVVLFDKWKLIVASRSLGSYPKIPKSWTLEFFLRSELTSDLQLHSVYLFFCTVHKQRALCRFYRSCLLLSDRWPRPQTPHPSGIKSGTKKEEASGEINLTHGFVGTCHVFVINFVGEITRPPGNLPHGNKSIYLSILIKSRWEKGRGTRNMQVMLRPQIDIDWN